MTACARVLLVVSLGLPSPATADNNRRPLDTNSAESSTLTTRTWREPRAPFDLHWRLLAIPEGLVEVALTPLNLLVGVVERRRLDRRLHDALRNEAETIVVSPQLRFGFGDGLGGGAQLKWQSADGRSRIARILGLVQLNRDYRVRGAYHRLLASLDGRALDVAILRRVDRDLPYYGLGNDHTVGDKRAIRSDYIDAEAHLGLFGRGALSLHGEIAAGWRHDNLKPGDDATTMSVGLPGDSVPAPAGFKEASDYLWTSLTLVRDSRDTNGRPTRGVVATASSKVTVGLDNTERSSISGTASVTGYRKVLPNYRVVSLNLGVAAVSPLKRGHDVPFHELVTLGRDHFLRGYGRARFRDRAGWWANFEYSYPLYEYRTTGVALSMALFTDVGAVDRALDELTGAPVRYSGGVILRGAHDTVRIFELQLGFSPDGTAFTLKVGSDR